MSNEVRERCTELKEKADRPSRTIGMKVYTDFESCREFERDWDDFIERTSGDIFQTWDWCRIWWRHYGRNRSLRIYVLDDGNRWVGLLPMFLEKVSLGPVSIRRVRLVGSDFISSQFRPAIEPGCMEPVIELLLKDLRLFSCDQVVFGPLAGRYEEGERMADILRERGGGEYEVCTEQNVLQSYYPLAETYDQWLKQLSSSQRNLFRREGRRLEKQNLSYRFEEADGNWQELFDDFVDLHQEDWYAKGKLGYFGDWPRSLEFHRDMVEAQHQKGRLRLFRVTCDDGSRSYAYNYRYGDMYFSILLARTLSSPKGVALGRLLHSEIVRHATKESVRWIDAMRGVYDYKSRQGGEYFPMQWIYLNRKGAIGRFRLSLFRKAAELFHLLYYKIYFSRIAPRLPRRWRGGLWRSWIVACGDLRSSSKSKAKKHS